MGTKNVYNHEKKELEIVKTPLVNAEEKSFSVKTLIALIVLFTPLNCCVSSSLDNLNS